jgi:hypothetical protein
MRKPGVGIALLGAIAAAVLSSCATTSLLTSWVDPEAGGKKLGNVLVVGVAKNAPARRQFEDSFAKVLRSRQIGALTSYVQLPDPAAIDEAAVKPIALKEKVTHVLVVRLVDRKTVTTYVPPTPGYYGGFPGAYPSYYGTWPGYYNYGYAAATRPGYTFDTEYVNLETNVYDAATGKLVWSGLTQTELGSRLQERIEEFIEVISGAMIRDKLI